MVLWFQRPIWFPFFFWNFPVEQPAQHSATFTANVQMSPFFSSFFAGPTIIHIYWEFLIE